MAIRRPRTATTSFDSRSARSRREVDPQTVLAFTMHVGVYCTGMLTEADITFNGVTFGWSDGNGGDLADVETVALHEIGHLLGLGHTAVRLGGDVPEHRRAPAPGA
jgi:hypothetical protein